MDPETFFPAPLEPADTAVALCGRCPVSGACLAWALSVGDCHGVWGGTTARERRAMLVAWRTEVQPEEAPYSAAGGTQADLVVAAGDLTPAVVVAMPHTAAGQSPAGAAADQPTAGTAAARIPAQRRADMALQHLVEGPTDLDDTLLFTREPVHAA
jgi:hypothetical protein